jgi:hypothetical protein
VDFTYLPAETTPLSLLFSQSTELLVRQSTKLRIFTKHKISHTVTHFQASDTWYEKLHEVLEQMGRRTWWAVSDSVRLWLQLSQRSLTGALLKHLSKLQVDEEPAIRTNTTILLGNIARHLNDAVRHAVCSSF